MKSLIKDATIINDGLKFKGSVLINGDIIESIFPYTLPKDFDFSEVEVTEATGLYLIPGAIDDQVHFREPGLTHKGDIFSESRAAVAGGVTSFMEMPNTIPQTVTQELLEQKYRLAAKTSAANYSFYMGATNTNLKEVLQTNPANVCGIKVLWVLPQEICWLMMKKYFRKSSGTLPHWSPPTVKTRQSSEKTAMKPGQNTVKTFRFPCIRI